MSIPHYVSLSYGDEKQVYSAARSHPLGTPGALPDGRRFRWAQAGGTALTPHQLCQARVGTGGATHGVNVSIDTALAGGNTIASGGTTVFLALTTSMTSGDFTGGYLGVETTPGEGLYKIRAATAQPASAGNSATAVRVVLEENDKLKVALTTVSKIALRPNPYSSIIVAPTALTAEILGVPNVTVPAANYFWLQTWGPAMVKYDNTIVAVVGMEVVPSTASAGNVMAKPYTDSGSAYSSVEAEILSNAHFPIVGHVMQSAIPDDGDNMMVFLKIAP